jgi:hypothetical protein
VDEHAGLWRVSMQELVVFLVDYVESRDRGGALCVDAVAGAPCLYCARTPCEIALRFAKAVEATDADQHCRREYRTPQTMWICFETDSLPKPSLDELSTSKRYRNGPETGRAEHVSVHYRVQIISDPFRYICTVAHLSTLGQLNEPGSATSILTDIKCS